MKTNILKTVLLFAVIIFFNCSNNDDSIEQDQLPPITQTGANTFGCVVNGKVIIPKDGIGVPQPKGINVYYFQNNNFVIDAANLKDSNRDRIYLYVNNLTSTGTYSFGVSNGQGTSTFEPDFPHCWVRTFDNANGSKRYFSNLNSGSITVTYFDANNHIVAGTFQLTVANENDTNDVIEITEGRFDVNWIEL
ncbi:DUF6252 family protein [Tenacibaculum tangerinum]|uniref:DUF6252 family protein n=1 Tax=Tenacibaculum tangerinum TaxID=3038772 RepID=A0ABY8L3C7_9FLAO|nr:DUF6252 family protein [Tenacibaculum tangerinum]WGH74390.1 DUF6252 family protein [Tenacibaculum tangerinum]